MSDGKTTNAKLLIESVDTDSLRTATVMRLVFEARPEVVEVAAALLLGGLGASVGRASTIHADGTREDITSMFASETIDPLDTGDIAGQ